MREKDSGDFDLETFVDLFDTAMTSDNPSVRKAFKNLLMITAIVHAEKEELDSRQGPLRRLVEDIHDLNRRLMSLEDQQRHSGGSGPLTPAPVPAGPAWVSPHTVGWPPNSTNYGASSTAYDDQFIPDPNDTLSNIFNKLEAK